MCKFLIKIICWFLIGVSSANANIAESSEQEEQDKLSQYSGVIGTAPQHETISNAGAAIELWPTATNVYGFFSQTRANNVFYEGRLYGRYNYVSDNPLLNTSAPDIHNPLGYGAVVKFGYSFHTTSNLDIIPYIRLNMYNNMSTVYADSQGNFIHSQTYAYLLGSKFAVKVNSIFYPYIDIYGGYQQVVLQGAFPSNSLGTGIVNGVNNQMSLTYELGLNLKISNSLALIPYMMYVTQSNSPNNLAALPISQGGLGVNSFTSTQEVYGFKLNNSW